MRLDVLDAFRMKMWRSGCGVDAVRMKTCWSGCGVDASTVDVVKMSKIFLGLRMIHLWVRYIFLALHIFGQPLNPTSHCKPDRP